MQKERQEPYQTRNSGKRVRGKEMEWDSNMGDVNDFMHFLQDFAKSRYSAVTTVGNHVDVSVRLSHPLISTL